MPFTQKKTEATPDSTSLKEQFPIQEIFEHIYKTNGFAGTESVSGSGSSLEQTATLRKALPPLLKSIQAATLLDAPCGDYFWMKEIPLDLELYIGADIVGELIVQNCRKYQAPGRQFIIADITKNKLPGVDCILCRDCLNHLSYNHIFAALENFKQNGATYLLVTTFPEQTGNQDIRTGGWRALNLQKPPFGFPAPLQLINEQCTEGEGRWADKSLGLWQITDLPSFRESVEEFNRCAGDASLR